MGQTEADRRRLTDMCKRQWQGGLVGVVVVGVGGGGANG